MKGSFCLQGSLPDNAETRLVDIHVTLEIVQFSVKSQVQRCVHVCAVHIEKHLGLQ